MKADSKDPPRLRSASGAALAALVVLGLAACSPEPDVTPAPAVADASNEVAPNSDDGPDDAAATSQPGLVTDVTWIFGDPPASWTKLETGDGQEQWQVRDECLFTLDQPSGINPDEVPVEQVLVDTEAKMEEALGFDLDPGPVSTHSFPVKSNAADVTDADVSALTFTSEAGATGSIYAYREGEYALIIYTACSANVPFDEVAEQEFAPFIDDEMSINLEY